MTRFSLPSHRSSLSAGLALLLFGSAAGPALVPLPAAAELPPSESCAQWEMAYATTGTLRVKETPMGAGDGVFPVGPGTLVLRVDARAARVTMKEFQLRERFVIHPSAMMWNATIVTDVSARALSDGDRAVAVGSKTAAGVVLWTEPVGTYRSDGTLTCDGSLCGKFGAPRAGRSELHQVSRTVRLEPLRFDRDARTFQMDFALVSSSESPHQRTYLALAGRLTARTCIDPARAEISIARSKPAANPAASGEKTSHTEVPRDATP
jgi:hypothetical protein